MATLQPTTPPPYYSPRPRIWVLFSAKNTIYLHFRPRGRVGLVSGKPSPFSQTAILSGYFLGTRTSDEFELNPTFWGSGSSTQSFLRAQPGSCLGELNTSSLCFVPPPIATSGAQF